jgi:hypothetical protein
VANIGFELLAAEKNNLIAMPTFGKDQPKNGRMKIFKLLQIWPGTLLSKTLTMKKNQKISRQIFRNPNTAKAKWRVEDCLFRVSLLPGASCPQITALYISPANGIFGR